MITYVYFIITPISDVLNGVNDIRNEIILSLYDHVSVTNCKCNKL